MYFAVVKLGFESQMDSDQDRRELKQLAEKIRVKFKVCAAVYDDRDIGAALAITAIGSSSERIDQTLDAISEFCESSGYGRVESEQALVDHFEALGDFCSLDE
ncbi:MAG: DUF503 domain-containing protein [Deltaproteobacteria bacterium]|nr:DUF503 domain-containing protein [Deltaproteobacteria bacterium]